MCDSACVCVWGGGGATRSNYIDASDIQDIAILTIEPLISAHVSRWGTHYTCTLKLQMGRLVAGSRSLFGPQPSPNLLL